MLKLYPNDVKVAHMHFPLRGHRYAQIAAIGAVAAQRQGKFWEYHDRVFANHSTLDDQKLTEIAKAIGLDMARFDKDKADPSVQRQVQSDLETGLEIGVTGTPAIFVNGRALKSRSVPGFSSMIEAELRKLKGGGGPQK